MAVFSTKIFPQLAGRHYLPRRRVLVTSSDEECRRHLEHLEQVIGVNVLDSTKVVMVNELNRMHQILVAKYGNDIPAPKSFAEMLIDDKHPVSVYKGETTRQVR